MADLAYGIIWKRTGPKFRFRGLPEDLKIIFPDFFHEGKVGRRRQNDDEKRTTTTTTTARKQRNLASPPPHCTQGPNPRPNPRPQPQVPTPGPNPNPQAQFASFDGILIVFWYLEALCLHRRCRNLEDCWFFAEICIALAQICRICDFWETFALHWQKFAGFLMVLIFRIKKWWYRTL